MMPDGTPRVVEEHNRRSARFDGLLLDKLCKHTVPEAGDEALVERIQKAYPEYPLHLTRLSHEWYRLGGIVKADGSRVAYDLNEWAERSFLECGQNFNTVLRYCEEEGFLATRHKGVTLYLIARSGQHAEDFVQIEADRSEELADRYLFNVEQPPGDLEELIDPLTPLAVEPFIVSASHYAYRRKTEVARFMQELSRHRVNRHPVQRFMDDWDASSAGSEKAFCEDWSLRLYQHVGRHGEQIMNVETVHSPIRDVPRLENTQGKKGRALARLLGHFDSLAGYRFAWYFLMLRGLVSAHVGEAVYQELKGDYAYLPARDAAVLSQWIAVPYSV